MLNYLFGEKAMKISSCLIVKNEAENIVRCLESIKDISDEIIVVDTGSTDNTKEIALSYGAKIYDFEWNDNFSDARNFTLSKASGDWIIFLDADEYFDANTQNLLKPVLKRIHNDKKFDALLCKRINTEGVDGRIASVDPINRIFRGHNTIRFEGAIHEQALNKNNGINSANITDCSLIIYHTGYSSVLLPEKVDRNLKILEKEIEKNNITNLTYYYMSSMNNNLNNYEEAIKYSLLALEDPTFKNTIVAYQPYVFLIHGMLNLKDKYSNYEIQKYLDEALSAFPEHPEIWHINGNVQKERNDYHAAIKSYLKAIELNNNFNLLMNNNFPARLDSVYIFLGELYIKTGEPIRALDSYVESLKINKFNMIAIAGLYELVKEQDTAEIIYFFNSIYNKSNKEDLVFLNSAMANAGNMVIANYYYKLHEEL